MRRAQASSEVVIATLLLCLLLSAGALVGFGAWTRAEWTLAGIAAERARSRGGEPTVAAESVLPRLLRVATRGGDGGPVWERR